MLKRMLRGGCGLVLALVPMLAFADGYTFQTVPVKFTKQGVTLYTQADSPKDFKPIAIVSAQDNYPDKLLERLAEAAKAQGANGIILVHFAESFGGMTSLFYGVAEAIKVGE
jgi:hypothetical protein